VASPDDAFPHRARVSKNFAYLLFLNSRVGLTLQTHLLTWLYVDYLNAGRFQTWKIFRSLWKIKLRTATLP